MTHIPLSLMFRAALSSLIMLSSLFTGMTINLAIEPPKKEYRRQKDHLENYEITPLLIEKVPRSEKGGRRQAVEVNF